MHYQVSRNGQMYGPYTLEDLQRYLASGNVLPTDLAKSEEMADWVPVSQLITPQAVPVDPPVAEPVAAFSGTSYADPAAFAGYYRWDVYYFTTAGDVLLPTGYAATSPIPVPPT